MENDPSLSKQIWYSYHLAASFFCFLNQFSMSRCSLNLESNKRRVQLLCFCCGACVLVPALHCWAPHHGPPPHCGLATCPSAHRLRHLSSSPCSRQGKLRIQVCSKIGDLHPKKGWLEHEFPGSHKHPKAYKDCHYYISQGLYQHQKIKNNIFLPCVNVRWV